jgi:hypothetical protein
MNHLESYNDFKKFNKDVDWGKYIQLNPDLIKAKITNPDKIYQHWMNYGIKEIRKYSDTNLDLTKNWDKISIYLRSNHFVAINWAFIITTCVRNEAHLYYLKECIRHIRAIYPKIHIYVINDNSSLEINVIKDEELEIIDAIAPMAGELNPYLFGIDPRCKHEKLVYIHDTVFLKKKIDSFVARENEIDFLWYDITAIHNDTIRPENADILNGLYLYFSNAKISIFRYLTMIKQMKIPFCVKFGSMSIFTKNFCSKLDLVTNIKEAAQHFKLRVHRCFLERLLSIFHIFIYGYDYLLQHHICGNILNHPNSFSNVNVNAPIQQKQQFVKVWQGR